MYVLIKSVVFRSIDCLFNCYKVVSAGETAQNESQCFDSELGWRGLPNGRGQNKRIAPSFKIRLVENNVESVPVYNNAGLGTVANSCTLVNRMCRKRSARPASGVC